MKRYLVLLLCLLLILPLVVQAKIWPPPPRWVLVRQRSVNIPPGGGYFDFDQFVGPADYYWIQFNMYPTSDDNGYVTLKLTWGLYAEDPSAPYTIINDRGQAHPMSGNVFHIDVSRSVTTGRLLGTVKVWRRTDM